MAAPIVQRSPQQLLEDGRAAWPAVPLQEEDFLRFVEERPQQERAQGLGGDLYLACACERQIPQALAAFEVAYVGQVPAYLSRVDGATQFIEDVRQLLRIRLFVPPAQGRPKIAEYRGRGPLGAWVRVVAINLALELKRAAQPAAVEDVERLPQLVAIPNPELDFIRVRYAEPFRSAFAAALEALEPRERTVLKLHLVHGLGIDKIAQLYQVHRSTAARWLVDVRERLYDDTRGRLVEELQLAPRELDSLLALVRSDIDVSVRRILGESLPPTPSQGR